MALATNIDHYENFPVASVLLPSRLRAPIEVIYHYARSADDIADEGDATPAERLSALQPYRDAVAQIALGVRPQHSLFGRVFDIVQTHSLPPQLFDDLIDAFMQDVVKPRYANRSEVLDYCRRSANPIGRLLLHLYGRANPINLIHSDAICSALQLINFWQDVAVDWKKNRVYLPQDDMARFGVTDATLASGQASAEFRALLGEEVRWARQMLLSGADLGRALPGRAGLELRVTIAGGARILNKIEINDYDVFTRRPKLEKLDWPGLLWRALVS